MAEDENVVRRLKRRLQESRSLGIKVRMEPLDGQQAGWCEIGGVPTMFVDLSQTAAEQLVQVEETLRSLLSDRAGAGIDGPADPNSRKHAA